MSSINLCYQNDKDNTFRIVFLVIYYNLVVEVRERPNKLIISFFSFVIFWFLDGYWAVSDLFYWKNKKAVIYHIIMIPLSTFFIVFLDSFKFLNGWKRDFLFLRH